MIHLLRTMTHSKQKEVRKAAINAVKGGNISSMCLFFLGKRLRDKDEEIRKMVFNKFTKNKIELEHFESKEARMLIIKEGLTDPSELVRKSCQDFLRQTIFKH